MPTDDLDRLIAAYEQALATPPRYAGEGWYAATTERLGHLIARRHLAPAA